MIGLSAYNPKLLIGVIACHHRAPHLSAIRNTWLPDTKNKCDYRFFFGRGQHNDTQPDEVIMDCDDAYRGLACKVQAACKWALAQGYEEFYKVDDDTYVRPERVVRAGFEKNDYVGMKNPPTDKYHENIYCRGGSGYYLSKRSLLALAAAPIPNPDIPRDYAEDSWVGRITAEAGIEATHDDRVRCADFSGPNRGPRPMGSVTWKRDVPTLQNKIISTCEFLGAEMLAVHEEWVKSMERHSALMQKIRL
jgi:hypothetical protein